MAFDVLLFNGGLKAAGAPRKIVKGVQHYKIQHYKDLNGVLGNNWHYQAINSNGDNIWLCGTEYSGLLHTQKKTNNSI